MKFEPLTKEQVEEWTTYQEEQGEKPDPNNIYFIDKIVGGVVPTSTSRRWSTASATATVKGAKYGFPCVDMQGDAAGRQVPRRGQLAGRVQAGGDGMLPRRPGQGGHRAAGADHERGGATPRRSTWAT